MVPDLLLEIGPHTQLFTMLAPQLLNHDKLYAATCLPSLPTVNIDSDVEGRYDASINEVEDFPALRSLGESAGRISRTSRLGTSQLVGCQLRI